MFSIPTSARRLSVVALPLSLLVACKDNTGLARKPLSVSFMTTTSSSPSASLASRSMMAAAAPAAAELPVISKVQLVLSEIELAQVSATCTGSAHGQEGECEDLELDPMLLELVPGTGVKTTLSTNVPVGKYLSLQAVIGPVSPTDDSPGAKAFLAKNPSFVGKSVRVEGTYKGQQFVYESALRGEIEADFDKPLELNDAMNITVALNMSQWFVARDGSVIDPATATAGSANHELVARNIRRSFRSFEDKDRSGREKQP